MNLIWTFSSRLAAYLKLPAIKIIFWTRPTRPSMGASDCSYMYNLETAHATYRLLRVDAFRHELIPPRKSRESFFSNCSFHR